MELQRGLGVLTSPCAAPKGAQLLRAYPALRLPSSPNSGEPGTPQRAGLSCRRPALRDSIAGMSNLIAGQAFERDARA